MKSDGIPAAERNAGKRHPAEFRAVHIDLKGMPPRPERLLRHLELYAASGYNVLLIEWEDMFPWKDPLLRRRETYREKDIQALAGRAAELNLEIIPLIQTLGHMENVLRHGKYAQHRELDWLNSELRPAGKSAKLPEGMIEEVLELLPQTRRLHMGGDEVAGLGLGHSGRAARRAGGTMQLYFRHMNILAGYLRERGVRPILWADMALTLPPGELKRYAADFDFAVWGGGDLERKAERIRSAGGRIWGAPCFKGADGITSDLPNLDARKKVISAYLELAGKYPLTGLIACGWSRYTTLRSQCEPVEGALDAAVMAGMLFSGESVSGEKISECLRHCGLLEDHIRSKELLSELTLLRGQCRRYLFDELELAAAQKCLRIKKDAKNAWYLLAMKRRLAEYETLKTEFHAHFDRFVSARLVEEYLEERFLPFRRGLKWMQSDCRRYGHPDAEQGYRELFGC